MGLQPQLMGCATTCIQVPIYHTGTVPQARPSGSPRDDARVHWSSADFISVIKNSEDEVRNDEDKGLGPDNANIQTGEHGHTWGVHIQQE